MPGVRFVDAGVRALLFLLVFAVEPRHAAAAQTCPFKLFRWEEDCSVLRGEAGSSSGLDQLRFIALNGSGSVWLTVGAQYRFKTEYLDAHDYHLKPVDDQYTAVGQRMLVHLDLRSEQGWRAFVQLSGAADTGRKPAGWLQRKLWNDPAAPVLNVFFFARDRARAVYEQGTASDNRRTVGVRFSGSDSSWDYAVQGARQYGSFAAADIDAFGLAGDVGWHASFPGTPRFGVSFGYASGDERPGDQRLGTFDVLYPNLGYFSDAPVYYPGNTADTQPNVTLTVTPSLAFRVGADVIFRVSKRDAVYGPPGVPALPGTGAGPSYVTTLSYIRSDWSITRHAGFVVSFVHGDAGELIRAAGGRAFNYGELMLDFRI